MGIGARTGDDAWSTIFLWGAEYLNWNVRWIFGYRGGGELRVGIRARRDRSVRHGQSAVTLRELIGGGFRPLTQQGKLTC